MGREKLVYSRPVEWQPARFRERRGASVVLLRFSTPQRPGEPPSTLLGRDYKPFSQPVQGLCAPCALGRRGHPAQRWQRSPWGCGMCFPPVSLHHEPTFCSLKRGNHAWGAPEPDPGLWERVAGQGETAKCPSQIPTALEIAPSTPSRALPPPWLCQGQHGRGEGSGKRWDRCHLIRESPWYSSALSPTTSPVLNVQVSPYFPFHFSAPPKRSLKGFHLLQASAHMGMTHQHSQLMAH